MGKTPKKAAPGGDERNLYVRRLKATTAPSRASESSLPERHREYENSNRLKLAGIQKKVLPGPGKNFKSKLRPPTKIEHQTKQHKILLKNLEIKNTDMQPGSEEAEVKLNVSFQKENVTEENGNNKAAETEKSAMSKEHIDHTYEKISSELQTTKTIEEVLVVDSKTVPQEEEVILEHVDTETKEEQEANDIKLIYEAESISLSNGKEILDDKQPKDNGQGEELLSAPEEMKNDINEKEETQSEVPTNNESCSVDIVESTTSELSETSESIIQSNIQKDKESIDDTINDPSFISYDSSIMLKDVKIRLNDCLKDNSKLYDVSNTEGIPNQLSRDQSFGRTLRNISGRHSIGRMRHVTLRENRISPNSSLFVNTSTMSMPQDEGIESKVLPYGAGLLSDTFSTNGSPLDRKRRIDTENWSSAKKQKTDEESSSIFNTSINLLKGLRIPSMQVSTPKATPYKFDSTKLDISGIKNDDNKMTAEPIESTKKWCVIM
ncbi:PREDICTED: putative leucine-rich repeat-containing protein DDB_G0290503 [Trachymyrmex cornetzi]|uniref:putative leucine-rich repeat-containing protein DDB_G0290503 n=1 Tax=Trachymyrmex cornetzi TaxID=471704 RepID=UPI00084F4CE1|nr:PREDICTED: putative leucine-rich repeat-containing protein DDB_G0290503 [Trachymyrmex cornetzi]XP_018363179.1 PREDICTED: putative leucine-rich repeat-containing protein DDB_G0290503 [Trachymyrmex cornetzi]